MDLTYRKLIDLEENISLIGPSPSNLRSIAENITFVEPGPSNKGDLKRFKS